MTREDRRYQRHPLYNHDKIVRERLAFLIADGSLYLPEDMIWIMGKVDQIMKEFRVQKRRARS